MVKRIKWRCFSNAFPCSWPTKKLKHAKRLLHCEANKVNHNYFKRTSSYPQTNRVSYANLCSSSSLGFPVSAFPLSSIPPLFVLKVHIQIDITPDFTVQGLNYVRFLFCEPEFIAAGLSPLTPGTSWNRRLMKPQSFCSARPWRVRGPLFIGSVGSAQHCFGWRVATLWKC